MEILTLKLARTFLIFLIRLHEHPATSASISCNCWRAFFATTRRGFSMHATVTAIWLLRSISLVLPLKFHSSVWSSGLASAETLSIRKGDSDAISATVRERLSPIRVKLLIDGRRKKIDTRIPSVRSHCMMCRTRRTFHWLLRETVGKHRPAQRQCRSERSTK